MSWSKWERMLLDSICVASGIGIWPRFIEPRWIEQRRIIVPLADWAGEPLQVLHLSDLHWGRDAPERSLEKALKIASKINPDLVFWTGDFLVDADTHNWQRLRELLNLVRGKFGTFACLGNHDYASYVSIDGGSLHQGEKSPQLLRILRRLIQRSPPPTTFPLIPPSQSLCDLLEEEGIVLLHNKAITVSVHEKPIEIGGIGDPWAGQDKVLIPTLSKGPRILMAHNPDSALERLADWTAILSGHTHGRQINLPIFGERLCNTKGPYTRGLYGVSPGRWVHVSRGLGCSLPFRIRSRPEVTWMTWLPNTGDHNHGNHS